MVEKFGEDLGEGVHEKEVVLEVLAFGSKVAIELMDFNLPKMLNLQPRQLLRHLRRLIPKQPLHLKPNRSFTTQILQKHILGLLIHNLPLLLLPRPLNVLNELLPHGVLLTNVKVVLYYNEQL